MQKKSNYIPLLLGNARFIYDFPAGNILVLIYVFVVGLLGFPSINPLFYPSSTRTSSIFLYKNRLAKFKNKIRKWKENKARKISRSNFFCFFLMQYLTFFEGLFTFIWLLGYTFSLLKEIGYLLNWLGIGLPRTFIRGAMSKCLKPQDLKLLIFHYTRFKKIYSFSVIVFYVPYMLLIFLISWGTIADTLQRFTTYNYTTNFIIILFFLTPITILISRIYFSIVQLLFPESLCVREILYLLFDLSRNDVLHNPERKKLLLYRTNSLARMTNLIAKRNFIREPEIQDWIDIHFSSISLYIRERERWIVSPNETTLENLRNDFFKLFHIYLSGKYGEFQWTNREEKALIEEPRDGKKILKVIFRLLGFVVPLITLGLYLWKPGLFPDNIQQNFDSQVVGLIFAAWLFVTLDINLKLGILEQFLKILKGLKDIV